MLVDRIRELATLVEADVTRRSADQPRDRVLLHVLGHVEANELDAHHRRELLRELGLADARRAGEQERTRGLVRTAEAGARQLDRRRERFDRGVLTEDQLLELQLDIRELGLVGRRDRARRDARDLRDDLLDQFGANLVRTIGRLHQAHARSGFIDHVDRLVRKMRLADVARGQLHRGFDRRVGKFNVVVLFVLGLEPLQDLDRLGHGRLADIDALEPALQRAIAFECLAVILERGRADAAQLAVRQGWLENVRCVHRAAAGRARADDIMDLVDEENRLRICDQDLHHGLETLFEVATVARACEHGSHVERVHLALEHRVRHQLVVDAQREALRECGLANSRLTDEKWVVLATAREHLDHALELVDATDQRIDLAVLGSLREIDAERFEWIRNLAVLFALVLGTR